MARNDDEPSLPDTRDREAVRAGFRGSAGHPCRDLRSNRAAESTSMALDDGTRGANAWPRAWNRAWSRSPPPERRGDPT